MKILIIVVCSVAAALLLFKVLAPRPCKDCGPMSALSTVRSALQVYYGDTEGVFPTDNLSCLTANGKYLKEIPLLWNPAFRATYAHPPTREVVVYSGAEPLRDTGKWAYFNNPSNKAAWGTFVIDCTHVQMLKKGRPGEVWSTY